MRPLISRRWLTASTLCLLMSSLPVMAQTAAVRVSSKIDTEGSLLGNMIIQALEAQGIKTENKVQLGTTPILRGAMTAGEIDIYPEYTGNGAFLFADEKNPAWKNAAAGYALVKKLDAEKNKVASLADLGPWLSRGGQFKLAASAEFIERSDALPAFQTAYGFKLNNAQLLTLAGGDTTATIKAAAQQTSGVNAAMVYGTDGAIAALGLVVLQDPQGIQPVYAPAALVRAATLAQQPKIKTILEPIFQTLTGPTLQALNAKIAVEGQDAKKVSADYLRAKGFIK